MDIGLQLKVERVKLRHTAKDIAKRSGVNQATLTAIENGKRNASIGTLKKIANALGKDIKITIE